MKSELREYDHCDPELSIEGAGFQATLRKDGIIDATIFGGSGYYAQDLSIFEEIPKEVAHAVVKFLNRHVLGLAPNEAIIDLTKLPRKQPNFIFDDDDIYPPLPDEVIPEVVDPTD